MGLCFKTFNGNERIKGSRRVKFKSGTPFSKEGTTTLQVSGISGHEKSKAQFLFCNFWREKAIEAIFQSLNM